MYKRYGKGGGQGLLIKGEVVERVIKGRVGECFKAGVYSFCTSSFMLQLMAIGSMHIKGSPIVAIGSIVIFIGLLIYDIKS